MFWRSFEVLGLLKNQSLSTYISSPPALITPCPIRIEHTYAVYGLYDLGKQGEWGRKNEINKSSDHLFCDGVHNRLLLLI